ncbi:unnamed protein product [Orchesella dallaii]|uniref:Uncharacterized protein n=1 Tax=Orchesella dallaii TaxID=48710 RepID=A0ABP1R501_9HEXA
MPKKRRAKRLPSSSSEDSQDWETLEENRKNSQKNLENIQQQHGYLHNILCEEKTKQLNESEKSIREGTHPDYLKGVARLKQEMNEKIESAEKLRQIRLSSVRLTYEAEELAIQQNFQEQKRTMKDSMVSKIKEHIRELKASRDEDFDTRIRLHMARNPDLKKKKTKAERIQLASRSRTSLPIIIYRLKDTEVLEDLAVVKQALACKARSDKKKLKKKNATVVAEANVSKV